jgi:hypothetical protein
MPLTFLAPAFPLGTFAKNADECTVGRVSARCRKVQANVLQRRKQLPERLLIRCYLQLEGAAVEIFQIGRISGAEAEDIH